MGNVIKSAGFGFIRSILEEFFEEVTHDRIQLSLVRDKSISLTNLHLKIDVVNILLQGLPIASPFSLQAGYIKQISIRGDGGISDFLSNGKVSVEIDGLCLVIEPSLTTVGDVEAVMVARKLVLELQDRLSNAYYMFAKSMKTWYFQLGSNNSRNQLKDNSSFLSDDENGALFLEKKSSELRSTSKGENEKTKKPNPALKESNITIRPWPLRMFSMKVKNTHLRLEWNHQNQREMQKKIKIVHCTALDITIENIILANCSSQKLVQLGKELSNLIKKEAQINLDNAEEAVWTKSLSINQLSLKVAPVTVSYKSGRDDLEDLPGKYLQAVIETLEEIQNGSTIDTKPSPAKERAKQIFNIFHRSPNDLFLKPVNLVLYIIFYFTCNQYTSYFKGVETKISALQLDTTNFILKCNLKQLESLQNLLADLLRSVKRNDYALLFPVQLYMEFQDNLDVLPPELTFYSDDPALMIVPNMVYRKQSVVNYLSIKRSKKNSQMYIKDLLKEKLGSTNWVRGMWKYVFSCIRKDLAASRPFARWYAIIDLIEKQRRYSELYTRKFMIDTSQALLKKDLPFEKRASTSDALSKIELKELFMLETVYISTDSILFLRAKCRLQMYLRFHHNQSPQHKKQRSSFEENNLNEKITVRRELNDKEQNLKSLCYTLSLSIDIKDRKHYLTTYKNTFLGSDAVNYFTKYSFNLEGYLLKYPLPQTISTEHLTVKDKVKHVLGEMLQNNFFVDVKSPKNKKFSNSSRKFYRFTSAIEEITSPVDIQKNIDKKKRPSDASSILKDSSEENECDFEYEMDIQRIWYLFYADCLNELLRETNSKKCFDLASDMYHRISLKERSQSFKSYKNTFLGTDAVKWMRTFGGQKSITQSLAILNILVERNFIHHVLRQLPMQNDRNLYVFSKEFEDIINNESFHDAQSKTVMSMFLKDKNEPPPFQNTDYESDDSDADFDQEEKQNDFTFMRSKIKKKVKEKRASRLLRFSQVVTTDKEEESDNSIRQKYSDKLYRDELNVIAQNLHDGIRIKDRYLNMIRYERCFKANHAIMWLMKNLDDIDTERKAILLLQIMMDQYHIFVPISPNAATIQNKRLLYRFLVDEDLAGSNKVIDAWVKEAEESFNKGISYTERQTRTCKDDEVCTDIQKVENIVPDFDDNVFFNVKVNLIQIEERLRTNINTHGKVYNGVLYEAVFVSSEAIAYLISTEIVNNEEEGLHTINLLISYGLVHSLAIHPEGAREGYQLLYFTKCQNLSEKKRNNLLFQELQYFSRYNLSNLLPIIDIEVINVRIANFAVEFSFNEEVDDINNNSNYIKDKKPYESMNQERILEIWFGSLSAVLFIDPVTISYPTSYHEKFTNKPSRLFSGQSCFIPSVLSIIISDCRMFFVELDNIHLVESTPSSEKAIDNTTISLTSKPLIGRLSQCMTDQINNLIGDNISWKWYKNKQNYLTLDVRLASSIDVENERQWKLIQNGSHNFDMPYLDVTLYHKGQQFLTNESTVKYVLQMWKATARILRDLNFDDQFDFYPRLFVPIVPNAKEKEKVANLASRDKLQSTKAAKIIDQLCGRNTELPSVKERIRHSKYMIQYLLSQFTIPGGLSVFIQSEGVKWLHQYNDPTRQDEYNLYIPQQQVLLQLSNSDSDIRHATQEHRKQLASNASMRSSLFLMLNNQRLLSANIAALKKDAVFYAKGKDDIISWIAELMSIEASYFPTWTEVWRGK